MQTFQLASKGIEICMYITREQAKMAIRAHFSSIVNEYIATIPDVVNKCEDIAITYSAMMNDVHLTAGIMEVQLDELSFTLASESAFEEV